MNPISKHFTFEELTKTGTGLDNVPTDRRVLINLGLLVKNLEFIRHICGDKPILVNSAFRSKLVNNAVGGSKNSQHLDGLAADITFGSPEKNKVAFQKIQEYFTSDLIDLLDIDQLIDEKDYRWIHIGFMPISKPRKQVLHLK